MKKKFLSALAVVAALVTANLAVAQGWSPSSTVISAVGSTTTGVYPASPSTGLDTSLQTSVLVHVASASTSSATVLIQGSVSGTFWFTLATISNPSSVGELWAGPAPRYLRVNLSVHASGTISAFYAARRMAADPVGSLWKKIDSNGLSVSYAALTATTGTFTNMTTSGVVTNTGSVQGTATAKALTESSATIFATLTVSSGSRVGGFVRYTIDADDGTDFQARSGYLPFSAVNKAGTITCTVGTVTSASEVVAVSSGTLTNTFTCADATGGVLNLLANATSSLTQTTLEIRPQVYVNGTSTVTYP